MEIRTLAELQELEELVLKQAERTRENLSLLDSDPLEALYTLKFEQFGFHPLEGRPWNLIEQLNQTFTILASIAAARYLFERFPECGGLRLNLATKGGRDIESLNPSVVNFEAEVFATVDTRNNRKLKEDLGRLPEPPDNGHCFVFFYSPSSKSGHRPDLAPKGSKAEVWALSREEIMDHPKNNPST